MVHLLYKNNFCNVACCFRFLSDDPDKGESSMLRVFDLTANKFTYALIAESLSTLQAADTSQTLDLRKMFLLLLFDKNNIMLPRILSPRYS